MEREAASARTSSPKPPRRSLKEIAEEAARLEAERSKPRPTPPVRTAAGRESTTPVLPSAPPSSPPASPRIATGTLVGATIAIAAIVASSTFVLVRTQRTTDIADPGVRSSGAR